MKHRRIGAFALAVGLLVIAGCGSQATVKPAPKTAVAPSTCHPDPAAAIASTPAGGVWQGSGCYSVPGGIVLDKPITIEPVPGSQLAFHDDSTVPLNVPGQFTLKPVITVTGSDVTIQNVSIQGGQVGGPQYIAKKVTQAGIYTRSSVNTRIFGVSVSAVYGDCLTLFQNGPRTPPTTNLLVYGFTCTGHGRFGISPSDVSGAVLDYVTIAPQPNSAAIDFESDVPGLGVSGPVTFNTLTAGNGIFIRESLGAAVTFNDAAMTGAVTMQNLNSVSTFPVIFNRGSLNIGLGRTIGVQVKGGAAAFNGTIFTRQPTISGKPQTNGMWYANTGASLAFNQCLLSPPLGTNDATSTVTVTP